MSFNLNLRVKCYYLAKKSNAITLLSIYNIIITVILILLLLQTYKYRDCYFFLLTDSQGKFRLERFYKEMDSTFKKIYLYLKSLQCKRRRIATGYCFQVRWLEISSFKNIKFLKTRGRDSL